MMTAEKCKKMEDTSEKCGMAERLMRCMMADKEGELDEESEKKCHEMWDKMLHEKEDDMKKKMEGCKDTTDEEMKKKCAMMQMKMDCMDEEKMMKMNEEMKRKCMMMKKEYNEQEAEKSKLDYYVA